MQIWLRRHAYRYGALDDEYYDHQRRQRHLRRTIHSLTSSSFTDGAQDNQVKGVPNGSWSGSNQRHDSIDTVCKPLKDRGIVISCSTFLRATVR